MYYLPWWMQWAQAIALIVISCLGSWIAFKQVRIAAAKLNFDLYDKRFKVFEAARQYLVLALQSNDVTPEHTNQFHLGVADAVFLFDKSIEEYLEEFRKKLAKLQMLNFQFRNLRDQEDERRGILADQLAEQAMVVNDEFDVLVLKFKPFLKLGNI